MAKDTSVMEYTAEDLIAHKLERAGILVAKPKFDIDGTDLLALLDVKDNAKFCRIQCKGRSLEISQRSSVEIKKRYASDGFVLFLFVETGDRNITHLFCFLGREIRDSWIERGDLYVLNLTASTLSRELYPYVFNDQRIVEIKKVIINMNVTGEFETMGHAYADLVLPALVGSASMSSQPDVQKEVDAAMSLPPQNQKRHDSK